MAYHLQKISVLVVEDNLPMLEITKSLLLTFGIGQVVVAQDGETGFRRFCQYNNDIIIADWMMKPMDGISFSRMVRNDSRSPNPYVPIILMTGFSEKRRVIEARDTGVTEFLVKPFNARDLYKRLVQVIERPRQFVRSTDFFGPDRRRKKESAPGDYQGPRRRENDPPNQDALKEFLQKQKEAHKTLERVRGEKNLGKGDKFDFDIEFRDAESRE